MSTYIELNNQVNIPENGTIPVYKDKEAVRAYFKEHVNMNTVFFHSLEEKLKYLVDEGYIEGRVLDLYEPSFVKSLFKSIYNHKFRFKSFMGAYKFYTSYALKTRDGKRYLERYEDRIAFNALALANGDTELARDIAEEMITGRYQPATPTYMNLAKQSRGEFTSCFLLDIDDSMESIGRAINSALQLSKRGGGVSLNLSNIRALGDPIKQYENMSSGVVPVMKLLEDSFRYANQLGSRSGAGSVYLNIFHKDVLEFLSTRKENAESAKQIKSLSLGLVVPDKFYELLETNTPMHLFSPYDIERVYGKPFSYVDITEEYDNMISNSDIRSAVISPRELNDEISKLQQESGYPYIMNVDTANKENPIEGRVIISNLC